MFISAFQPGVFAPTTLLASTNGNGNDILSIVVGKYLNLAANLEDDLRAGILPQDYIENNQGHFSVLERLNAFRNEYETLESIFTGRSRLQPRDLESLLRMTIGSIHQTAQRVLTPAEYQRYTEGDQSPVPPAVTEASPPPSHSDSHFTGPPTTPSADLENEVTQRYSSLSALLDIHTAVTKVDAEITERMLAPISSEDTLTDTYAGHEGIETPDQPPVLRTQISEETLNLMYQGVITKRIDGDFMAALKLCEDGIRNAKDLANQRLRSMFFFTAGETLRQMGYVDKAMPLLEGALEYFETHPDPLKTSQVHQSLSMALSDQEQWTEAIEHAGVALQLANENQNERQAAVAELSLAIALLGNGDIDLAVAASGKSLEALERQSGTNEYDLKARITHALALKEQGDLTGAAKLVGRTHLLMRERAQERFDEEWQRNRFLNQVKTHLQIERAWLSLRNYLGVDTDEQIRRILNTLAITPAASKYEGHALQIRPAILHPKFQWSRYISSDKLFGATRAEAVVDLSLSEVVRSIVTKPLEVPENKGEWPGVTALGIVLLSLFDRNLNFYEHVSWNMHAVPGMEQLMHAAGVKDKYEHLLKGTIAKQGDHTVVIELEGAETDSIELSAEETLTVPSTSRPKPAEFGKLRFYFEALDAKHTRIVFEFENTRFLVNPENFLRAFLMVLAR